VASILRATSVEAAMNLLNLIHLRLFELQPVSTTTIPTLENDVQRITGFLRWRALLSPSFHFQHWL
jgi:hypothetical protein